MQPSAGLATTVMVCVELLYGVLRRTYSTGVQGIPSWMESNGVGISQMRLTSVIMGKLRMRR